MTLKIKSRPFSSPLDLKENIFGNPNIAFDKSWHIDFIGPNKAKTSHIFIYYNERVDGSSFTRFDVRFWKDSVAESYTYNNVDLIFHFGSYMMSYYYDIQNGPKKTLNSFNEDTLEYSVSKLINQAITDVEDIKTLASCFMNIPAEISNLRTKYNIRRMNRKD